MKTSHWTSFLFFVVFAIFILFATHLNFVDIQTDENLGAQAVLIDASKSALTKADLDKVNIFAEEESREAALDEFKECYNIGFAKEGYKENDMYYNVPCIFLVDDNGYYVNYTKLVSNGGLYESVNMTSSLNSWTDTYGNYIVRFHLSDVVEVTYQDGSRHEGPYDIVYHELGSPTALAFMADETHFEQEKNDVICSLTENAINYYITTHNEYANKDNRDYVFTMPRIDTQDSRLMDSPCIISFVQGLQEKTGKGYINAYAFTAAIKDKKVVYYEYPVGGQLYYHVRGCHNLVLSNNNRVGQTMDDCALDGALPCPDCIK